MSTDDLQLLLATHRGHDASARLLWGRHAPRMLAYARSILGGGGAAEDAVQSVFCRLLALPRARVGEVRDVPAFLAAAVRREAINQLRSARRESARRSGVRPSDGAPPEAVAATGDVAAAIDALPRRFREVVVLRHVGGLTFDQLAETMGTNRSTVASRYRAALRALRDYLLDQRAVVGGSHG